MRLFLGTALAMSILLSVVGNSAHAATLAQPVDYRNAGFDTVLADGTDDPNYDQDGDHNPPPIVDGSGPSSGYDYSTPLPKHSDFDDNQSPSAPLTEEQQKLLAGLTAVKITVYTGRDYRTGLTEAAAQICDAAFVTDGFMVADGSPSCNQAETGLTLLRSKLYDRLVSEMPFGLMPISPSDIEVSGFQTRHVIWQPSGLDTSIIRSPLEVALRHHQDGPYTDVLKASADKLMPSVQVASQAPRYGDSVIIATYGLPNYDDRGLDLTQGFEKGVLGLTDRFNAWQGPQLIPATVGSLIRGSDELYGEQLYSLSTRNALGELPNGIVFAASGELLGIVQDGHLTDLVTMRNRLDNEGAILSQPKDKDVEAASAATALTFEDGHRAGLQEGAKNERQSITAGILLVLFVALVLGLLYWLNNRRIQRPATAANQNTTLGATATATAPGSPHHQHRREYASQQREAPVENMENPDRRGQQ